MMNTRHRQSGSTLLISLVMLVMLTLFVLTVINTTNINFRIVRNIQVETELQAAAQLAIEQVVSNANSFFPIAAGAVVPVDIDNDGTNDYQVTVATPLCTAITPIKTVDLDITIDADKPCLGSGAVVSGGIVGLGGAGNSLCSNSRWDVRANATDPVGGATSVVIHQGVAIRVPAGTAC